LPLPRFLDLLASSPVAIPTELPPKIKRSNVGNESGSATAVKREHNNTQLNKYTNTRAHTHTHTHLYIYIIIHGLVRDHLRNIHVCVTNTEVCLYSIVIVNNESGGMWQETVME
jgi:hypothetical protein